MKLGPWMKRQLLVAAVCLAAIALAGLQLAGELADPGRSVTAGAAAVNAARLHTNGIMLFLEAHASAEALREQASALAAMAAELNVELLVAGPDGGLLFSTPAEADRARTNIDLRTELHYGLHDATAGDGMYRIAFPIVDAASGGHAGSAVFALPRDLVEERIPASFPALPAAIAAASLLALAFILLRIGRRWHRDVLRPILVLRSHSEAILKGNYGQPAEHASVDEVGELYAVFDQMREEIRFLHQRKLEQDRAQKELITNISHDLKTPLATVKAYLDAIREGVAPDLATTREYVDIMATHADKMSRLIEDLLLHAMKELGQISVEPKEQYSGDLFRRILAPVSHFVQTSGVVFHAPEQMPNVLIRADADRLEQVIGNLIANSLKATKKGDAIAVDVRQLPDRLVVTVADTGEGIMPEDMPFLFDRYYQGRPSPQGSSAAATGGNGLGLSICKHIIEAHGGTIGFTSAGGEGTVFTFTLPL